MLLGTSNKHLIQSLLSKIEDPDFPVPCHFKKSCKLFIGQINRVREGPDLEKSIAQ